MFGSISLGGLGSYPSPKSQDELDRLRGYATSYDPLGTYLESRGKWEKVQMQEERKSKLLLLED